MARTWIVQGDATSSGGTVVGGSPFTDIDGFPVARIGDQATCPTHKGAFPIADGDPTTIIDGQPVALHGSTLACGCKVLAVRQSHVFLDAGAIAATFSIPAAATPLAAGVSAAPMAFDEAFILKSELTGKPLANRRYRIFHEDGRCEEGTTDPQGTTRLAISECCERLRIELEEEGP
ncbi:PAAR domain-containing protein [Luteimonas terrae]|uniref:Zn-binding protein involved in type VI secretion n=1 Tax=Luteimonas terrae TaxID=1530191 RepID=A0ABU1Y0G8_9GAMM|nr:PAAR domain-containing protein [Luteimonas terrae]MDR7194520.1 putative Zn-binding protein involved in type VI secretion [Luteimonas terrae]